MHILKINKARVAFQKNTFLDIFYADFRYMLSNNKRAHKYCLTLNLKKVFFYYLNFFLKSSKYNIKLILYLKKSF